LIFRNFYALPPMHDATGRPVNAVYGFMAMMFREILAMGPTHVAVACDVPISENRRTQLLASYKGNRTECPPDLAPQFGLLREVLSALRIPWLTSPGYEADDILGAMSLKAEAAGMEASLLTGDRDVLQLLSGQTHVRYVKKLNATETYDVPRFAQEFDLLPGQLADLKGLAGDPSDNIPGIHGVGAKTAVKLLKDFDTVEGVLANAHTQTPKLRQKLEDGREMALLSKRLATIDRAVPDLPEPGDCLLAIDREAGRAKFEELRFKSLLGRLAV
jgi:DNA polymerase-1